MTRKDRILIGRATQLGLTASSQYCSEAVERVANKAPVRIYGDMRSDEREDEEGPLALSGFKSMSLALRVWIQRTANCRFAKGIVGCNVR